MKKIALFVAVGVAALTSCTEDEVSTPMADFTVTIENVFVPKDFFAAGTTDGIGPGSSYSFTFHAGKGHYLSLATMLAQSNDLFYGFDDAGIALYDDQGSPLSGDVTDMVYLWDAGTEVNEEPGAGENQAPRQSDANTGVDENSTVKMIEDVQDGFTYPAVGEVINVSIENDGADEFTVTISNYSDQISLMGPLAPGVWAVHAEGAQIFVEGSAASSGLEMLSEDGNNTELGDMAMMNAGLVSPFAPGVFAVFGSTNPIFMSGAEASAALEAVAEDGDPSGFDFDTNTDVAVWGTFATPVSGSGPAPIFPTEAYEFSFNASKGDVLSFATMLVQTNDLFVGPTGINLFDGDIALSGDITSLLKLWDASTEVNEYPGAGNNQAPRQAGPNTGANETGTVMEVNDGLAYPALTDMIKVTVSTN